MASKHGSRKAEASWVSWVLIMGMSVGLSAMMYGWMSGYTDTAGSETITQLMNPSECDSVSLDIQPCQDHGDALIYVNATNRGSVKIQQVLFHLYEASGGVVNREVNSTIWPNDESTIEVLRQGVVRDIEAVPVLFAKGQKGTVEIICTTRQVLYENVPDCS